MTGFPQRKRIRLKGYDYSLAGAYFITICTKNRVPWFGEVVDGEMRLNEVGEIKQNRCRNWLVRSRPQPPN